MLLLFLAALPIALLWLNVGPMLVALGQDPAISDSAAAYACFGLPDLAGSGEKTIIACMPSEGDKNLGGKRNQLRRYVYEST
jgi:hypothetical protein